MKLDYKAGDHWKIQSRPHRRRGAGRRRHFFAMAVCALLTFIGYAKFNGQQKSEAEAGWSMPPGAVAAYPVLDDKDAGEPTAAPAEIDNNPTSTSGSSSNGDSNFRVAALQPIPSTSPADEAAAAETLADDAEYEILREQSESVAKTDLDTDWQKVSVKSGDSMARIFQRLGLSARQLHDITQLGKVTRSLKHLRPGQELLFNIDKDGERAMLQALRYDPDNLHELTVQRTADGFKAELADAELTTKVRAASATINSSLFLAGQRAGMSDNLIMQLVNIYGWDIDFALDIRKGDQFTIIFQETYRDGEKIKDGPIIAAEFQNQDRTLRAVRYKHPNGKVEYYADNGDNMRKAFIRTPLDVYRISSHFDPNRKHPVLNRIRAHQGTDYAAPRGTPVKATGDGRVIHVGRKGGYGNTLILKHGGKYSTLYAHLSRYAGGIHHGSRVEQGQVIAYVGSSGLATGSHLHYEFRVNGSHKNPVTVNLPEADSLPEKYMADFKQATQPLMAELEKLQRYGGQLEVADHQVGNQVLAVLNGDAVPSTTR